jgi:hypothetical protein
VQAPENYFERTNRLGKMTRILENQIDKIKQVRSEKNLFKHFVKSDDQKVFEQEVYDPEMGCYVKRPREGI